MDWKVVLGTNILRYRLARGWTQQDVACHADLSVRFVAGVERGEENPSLETIISIGAALDAPLWQLLYPDPD